MTAPHLWRHARLATFAPGSPWGWIEDGTVITEGDRITWVGADADLLALASAHRQPAAEIDLQGALVTPGLVDAHTHLVWAGSRADEFEARLAGAGYVELLAAGGGIHATVRATRAASTDALVALARTRLDVLLDHGVTTVEAKTGYGLDADEELRHLDVIAAAAAGHPVRVVPTYLGAHALPVSFADRRADFVAAVVDALPAVAAHPLAARGPLFCDVFCDDGAFDLGETRAVLSAAKTLGLGLKVHSDEFARLGATTLAAALGAASADHLVATSASDRAALAAAGTVATLLPLTTIGLGSTHFADGAAFVRDGVPVAVASDWNPGTAPCPNLWLALAVATRYGRLTVPEALVAVTRNAAAAVGRDGVAGRLAVGRPADIVVTDAEAPSDLAYAFGTNRATAVMANGRWVRPPAAA